MKLFRLSVLEDRVCPETKWEEGKEHLSVLFNQVFLLSISEFAALPSALLFSVVGSALTGHSCANEMGTLGPHCTFGRQQQAWHPSHCLGSAAPGVYLLMEALQLWSPLLLSKYMNNEAGH